jgi:hypothetical protein
MMRPVITYLLILSLIALSAGKLFNSRKVVYAIDCGNSQGYKSAFGFYYQPDNGFSRNTKVADYNINTEVSGATIKYTNDPTVYMTERHADETFWYEIPVQSSGKYVLILKFTELYFKQSGKRVFNIKFGETRVAENIDVYQKVGALSAYDEYIEFELQGDQVFVQGKKCGAAYKGGKLLVEFEKIGRDNPKVDGIVLFQGELSETDYSDQPQMREDWDRRVAEETKKKEDEKQKREEAKMKRKEKVKVRNDEYDDWEDEFEDISPNAHHEGSFLSFLTNPIVITLALVFAGVSFMNSGKSSESHASSKKVAEADIAEDFADTTDKKAGDAKKKASKKK